MESVRQTATKPELALRRALHQKGLRYRVNTKVISELRTRADVVFTRARVAIFVDGCFWHGCPEHGTWPKANAAWWKGKIGDNKKRDQKVTEMLTQRGWMVIRVWEHEDPSEAAKAIESVVLARGTRRK